MSVAKSGLRNEAKALLNSTHVSVTSKVIRSLTYIHRGLYEVTNATFSANQRSLKSGGCSGGGPEVAMLWRMNCRSRPYHDPAQSSASVCDLLLNEATLLFKKLLKCSKILNHEIITKICSNPRWWNSRDVLEFCEGI